jgi:hypothetical protein
MSLILSFSAAITRASRRWRLFAPVLIVADDPEKAWKYTVPVPNTPSTSFHPQKRRIS